MKILVAGASGFLGTEISKALKADGHEVVPLVRREPKSGEVRWKPSAGELDPADIQGIDAAINLSGENIFGRWTEGKKKRILQSRLDSTTTLCKALVALDPLPSVLVSVSGANYYGDRGDEELSEKSGNGKGFLADVCRQWEEASQPAQEAGIRVVNPRMGIVLSSKDGALKKMLLPFKLGIGGWLGHGKQFMPWIALDDVIGGIRFVLENSEVSGAVNFASPNSVRNSDFTKELAAALKRPAILPVPAFALRAVLGDAADDMLLASVRVTSTRLTEFGYQFKCPTIAEAFRKVL